MKPPWYTQLDKKKILSKKEWVRRYKSKKKGKRRRRLKTPRQWLLIICDKYGLSTRGNTTDIYNRIMKSFYGIIGELKKEGAPACFGQNYIRVKCQTCLILPECLPIVKAIRKAKREYKKYLLRLELQDL